MNLKWIKCTDDVWCKLATVNLGHSHFENMEGDYIIWYGEDDSPVTVRVGQGVIKDRLEAHREDKEVQAYKRFGLLVTWASVAKKYRDGVEAYLAQELESKVGERFPDRDPIEVNLPW